MLRKICHIGNSQGVLIPKEILEKLHLTTGSQVEIKLNEETSKIIIEPAKTKTESKAIDPEFAAQVKDFVKLYKPALKALAKK